MLWAPQLKAPLGLIGAERGGDWSVVPPNVGSDDDESCRLASDSSGFGGADMRRWPCCCGGAIVEMLSPDSALAGGTAIDAGRLC